MRGIKNVRWAVAIAVLIIAMGIFLHYQFHSSSSFAEKDQNKDNLSVDVHLNNNIENHIDSKNADVTNNVINRVDQGKNVNLDNNVINNIDVTVDVHVSNNVENEVTSSNGDSESKSEDSGKSGGESNNNSDSNNGNDEEEADNNDSSQEIIWGADSASITNDERIACVRDNYGDPQIWGRYLGDKDGVSFGLTEEEVKLLHEQDIHILIIWNHFEDATGYDKGYAEANEAIQKAYDFNIPEGVALFANVEPIYPIDSGFIEGWYDALEESAYTSGIYGIFDPSEELYAAFEAAAENNNALLDDMYIWTASPNAGITTEENAPEYNPESPEGSTVIGWQYGIDSQNCNIDTNWFNGNYSDVLW